MNEIRTNEVFMVGRIAEGPIQTKDGLVHIQMEALTNSDPFHCVCAEKTAENLLKHCSAGDEVSIQGSLRWINFPNTGKTMVIYMRFISYGRKVRDISQSRSDS